MDETLGMIHQFNSFIHSFSQSITTNCTPVPTMPSTVLNVIPELTICYALEDFCIQLTHTTIPMWQVLARSNLPMRNLLRVTHLLNRISTKISNLTAGALNCLAKPGGQVRLTSPIMTISSLLYFVFVHLPLTGFVLPSKVHRIREPQPTE